VLFIFWALLGALIGISAAQHRGFSIAGGIIGGLLLGPLAFLLFFMSGLVSHNDMNANKKCPHCAEWVKADAKVCKYCGRDIPPPPAARPVSGVRPPAVRPTGPRPGTRPGTRPAAR